MGGRSRLLSTSLVLLMLISVITPFATVEETSNLEDEIVSLDSAKSTSLVDVPSLRIGDQWVYDAFFDVGGLIAAGGVSANVQTLTGTLTGVLQSIGTQTVENRSSLVYTIRSTGSFGANGVSLDGYTGNLDVDYVGIEEYRVSDMALITRTMELEVGFLAFGFINIDVADITILTTYQPPQENYDFPLAVGEGHYTNYTATVQWSGSSDYFAIPEDETRQTSGYSTVTSSGDPGVSYSGCSNSYNVTQYNSDGTVAGFNWYCPAVKYNAWQHIEDAIGLVIDFKLKAHTPASRARIISVNLQYPAYFLDIEMGAWINVTDAGGTPVGGENLEFRYEAESDIRQITTATNGSAYVVFDTGHFPDPSETTYDFASHGIIGWISSSNQVGVSTLTLDDDLVEVDLVTNAASVAVERVRGADVSNLNSINGYNVIPGDELTFSVPVRNAGLLYSPATQLEVTAPDGTTSRANVPSLAPLAEARAEVSWTVPSSQSIGDVTVSFEADPDEVVTQDANRSNNQDSLTIFVGRLPSASLANTIPTLTFDDVLLDATMSSDPDGGDLYCQFEIEEVAGTDPIITSSYDCEYTMYWEDNGDYDVILTIYDDEGDSYTITQTVNILNRAAVVNLASNVAMVKVGEPVTFDAYDQSDVDTTTSEAPISMQWLPPNDPNGMPYACDEGMVTMVCTVTPEVEGQFMMSFRGIDDDGALTSATHSIMVNNIAPSNGQIDLRNADDQISILPDQQQIWWVDEDQSLELVGDVTDSPNDMDSLTWMWQPDVDIDPTLSMTSTGATSVIPVSWSEKGLHKISMQVFDDDDESSGIVSRYVRVQNVPPTIADFEQQLPLWEDQNAQLTADFSDSVSDVDSLVACWDTNPFVNSDGEFSADDDCDISGSTLTQSWPSAGSYQVIFHVTDDDGDRTSEMVNFTVRNRKPVAAIVASNLLPETGEKFSLSGNLSTDTASDMDDLIYRWDLDTTEDADDDGFADNDFDREGMEIWIDISSSGTHTIRLMVFDESEVSTADVVIEVQQEESGFLGGILSFEDNGVAIIVIILLLVLASLLGVLGWTSMRGKQSDPWEGSSADPYAVEEMPSSAPNTSMFAAPTAEPSPVAAPVPMGEPVPATALPSVVEPLTPATPPLPDTGLPAGWTMEQWSHYGAQWLEQEAAKVVETPPPTWPSSEGDMDLDL
ncbi:MAG: CARDB domain-containing protein [Candidatus Thalassarchaeaceae archaeon]|nr:CARDB domain-containing protein [Candidatus Thalassarchaeaceae archaeon]